VKLFKKPKSQSIGMTSRCEAVATVRQPRKRSQLGHCKLRA
jgi:hypothetical protein